MEAQKAQSVIITSLSEKKDFNNIKTVKGRQRQHEKNKNTSQNICEPELQTLWFKPCAKKMSDLWKGCAEYSKINNFREVYRSGRNRTVHDLKKESDKQHYEVDHIGMVNIIQFILIKKKDFLQTFGNNCKSKNVIILSFNNSAIYSKHRQ